MDRRILFVTSLIEADFRSQFDLAELAESVNLSPSRLRHLFKAETGTTVVQFQKTVRMKRGRELLGTTFLSVKEIMSNVGFSDQSYFVHEFKKFSGVSPSAYRKLLQASVETSPG